MLAAPVRIYRLLEGDVRRIVARDDRARALLRNLRLQLRQRFVVVRPAVVERFTLDGLETALNERACAAQLHLEWPSIPDTVYMDSTEGNPHGNTRRNVGLLAACQALLFTNNTTLIAINGLAGLALAPHPALATLPVTCWVLGGALSTMRASLYMKRVGRRTGLIHGAAIGVI